MSKPSLNDFLPEKPENLIFVTNANQVDVNEKNAMFVGSEGCGWSKLGVSQFNDACDDLKDAKCYMFDVSNEDSKKAADDLGVIPDGFPTHFIHDGKGEKTDLVGMRTSKMLKPELKKLGFKL